MFRYLLVASTALIFAGSVSFAAAGHKPAQKGTLPKGFIAVSLVDGVPATVVLESQRKQGHLDSGSFPPVVVAGATFNNFSKDRNAEFLSWYGFSVSAYWNSSSASGSFYSSGYTRMAIPITGQGKTVTTITVPVAGGGEYSGNFTVGLYTNGPAANGDAGAGGTPAKQIVTANAVAAEASGYCCGQIVTVPIPSTKLNKGTLYWIVESGIRTYREKNEVAWLGEDTDYTGDTKPLFQYHQYLREDGYTQYDYTSPWESPGSDNWTEPAAEVE